MIHGRGELRIDAIALMLEQRATTSDTELEAAAAELVEHADLLEQAQRMIERQQIDERPEAQPARALRDRRKKDAGRGRAAERRAVMLGQVIGVEALALDQLDEPQALLELRAARRAVVVEMIENSEAQH